MVTKVKEKKTWDEVSDVKSSDVTSPKEKTTPKPKNKKETVLPFGNTIDEFIVSYRKHVSENPIEKNGIGTAPDNTKYHYFLTEDVSNHINSYCEENGAIMSTSVTYAEGTNILEVTVFLVKDPKQSKRVSASIGTAKTLSDFGARFTYVPKYLMAILFGISVQTDTDAFNNGVIKEKHEVQRLDSGDNNTISSSTVTVPSRSSDNVVGDTLCNSVDDGNQIAKSASFIAAETFINKSQSELMLQQAETKLSNSSRLTDDEKVLLNTLIGNKRKELN